MFSRLTWPCSRQVIVRTLELHRLLEEMSGEIELKAAELAAETANIAATFLRP